MRQERTGNDLVLRYCELIKAVLNGDGLGVSRAALDTLSAVPRLNTSALHDPRLVFALRQQEFTELLRKGGPDCELAAIRAPGFLLVMQTGLSLPRMLLQSDMQQGDHAHCSFCHSLVIRCGRVHEGGVGSLGSEWLPRGVHRVQAPSNDAGLPARPRQVTSG